MDERGERIQALIDKWVTRLGVGDWVIRYAPQDSDPETRGSANLWWEKRSGTVRISLTAPLEVEDEIVCHEILHFLIDPPTEVLEDALRNTASPQLFSFAQGQAKEKREVAITQLTQALIGRPVQCWPVGGDEHWVSAFPVIKEETDASA